MRDRQLLACMMAEVATEQQAAKVCINTGDLFFTFDELNAKLKAYERQYFVQFWKRDARTVEAAKKRLDRFIKPELKYYEIKYCCIIGGQAFKAKGKGSRTTS